MQTIIRPGQLLNGFVLVLLLAGCGMKGPLEPPPPPADPELMNPPAVTSPAKPES